MPKTVETDLTQANQSSNNPHDTTGHQSLLDAYNIDAGEAFTFDVGAGKAAKPKPVRYRDPTTNLFVSNARAVELGLVNPPDGEQQGEQFNHPRSVVKSARLLGMSTDDIAATHPDDLHEWIAESLEDQRGARGQGVMNAMNQQQNGQHVVQNDDGPVAANERPITPPKPFEEEFFADLGQDEDGTPFKFDEIHPAYRATNKKLLKELMDLRNEVRGLKEAETGRARETLFNEFDQVFNQNPEFFGKGPTAKLKGAHRIRRDNAIEQVKNLFKQKKHTNPTADIKAVNATLYGLQYESDNDGEVIDAEPQGQLQAPRRARSAIDPRGNRPVNPAARFAQNQNGDRGRFVVDTDQIPAADFYQGGSVQRPTHRVPAGEQPGPARMAARLDKLMREQGGEDYDFPDDAFPG